MDGAESNSWSRRALLGAGFAAAATLLAGPALAARPARTARTAPRNMPDRQLFLLNANTGERFRGTFWQKGRHLSSSLGDINRLMRDHRVDETAPIDPDLVDVLYKIQSRIDPKRPILITSGYRSPLTNAMLQAEGYNAADNSLHMVGKAADIHIERVRLVQLRKIAVALRAGGVGTYGAGNFLHLDTGRVRFW
jgi:uncharacterized protein YcbK (DUF882 family)